MDKGRVGITLNISGLCEIIYDQANPEMTTQLSARLLQ